MTLRTRKPTGRPAWPLVLLEGGEKSGKSWLAAELAQSPHIGRTVWIDLGEGSGDEYLDPDDPRHQIVEHNGTYAEIANAITTAKTEAAAALAAGKAPTLIVVDSQTLVWELLSTMVDLKARARLARKLKRDVDADETVNIGTDLWNEANTKHRRLMTMLMTWPGIAIITARGKETAAMGKDGKPIEGKRDYKVEGQRNLGFDASIWVRLSRDEAPTIHAIRTKNEAFRIRPGVDRPRQVPDFSLEWLLFDKLGYSADMAQVRDLVQPQVTPGDLTEESAPADAPVSPARPPAQTQTASAPSRARELAGQIAEAGSKDALSAAWKGLAAALTAGEITDDQADKLRELWHARKPKVMPASQKQHAHMHVLWGQAGYGQDREARLAFTSEIVGRDVASSKDLTGGDYDLIVERLKKVIEQEAQAPAGAAA